MIAFAYIGIIVVGLLALGCAIPILDLAVRFWVRWWWQLRSIREDKRDEKHQETLGDA